MNPRVVILHSQSAGPLALREVDGGEVIHAESGPGAGWFGATPPLGARLWIEDRSSIARFRQGDAWIDVPLLDATHSTLARNGGVLESTLLADASVAVIGLGSGGSLIADQLARAGVGELVLVDFDTLEASNVGRHLCDTADLGRRKTAAVADALRRRVPGIRVRTADLDVVADPEALANAVAGCHVLVGATDSNASRRVVNRLALASARPAIFGRAYTRACGGDVARVSAGGPCWECLFAQVVAEEEVASVNSAGAVAYADAPARAEPGLALDIAPIAQMCARLVIVELVRGKGSTLESLDDDLVGSFFLWANRREGQFALWPPMGFGLRDMAVQRWYAMRTPRVSDCAACGEEQFVARLLSEAGCSPAPAGRGA